MAVNDYLKNIRLGTPPIVTPIVAVDHDSFAMPYALRGDVPSASSGTIHESWAGWFKGLGQRVNDLPCVIDTHANRIATANPAPATPPPPYLPDRYLGMLFYETDRHVLYISMLVANVPAWVYLTGECQVTQASIAGLGLGTNDAGFIAAVTDYGHRLRWSGAAWGWAPGDAGSGAMQLFEVDPTGVGWHLYDGATVNYLKADGTLGSVTLPNLAGTAAYPKAGTPNSGPNAATAPTVSGSTASATTGVTPPANTGNNSGTTTFAVGTGLATTVAANPHTHTIGALTDPGHTHALGSIAAAADGEPRNLVRRPFFRQ